MERSQHRPALALVLLATAWLGIACSGSDGTESSAEAPEFNEAFSELIKSAENRDPECDRQMKDGIRLDTSQEPVVGYTFPVDDGGTCVFTDDGVIFRPGSGSVTTGNAAGSDASGSADGDVAEATGSATGLENVFDVELQRETDPWGGPWGYVDSPPFGALSPGELPSSPYPDGEPTAVPEFEERWVACREGDGGACDDLAVQGALTSDPLILSAYIEFGETCGGRVVDTNKTCVALLGGERTMEGPGRISRDSFEYRLSVNGQLNLRLIPGPDASPPGADPELDELWIGCGAGSGSDCQALKDSMTVVWESPERDYFFFAASCGGRSTFEVSCPLFLAPRDARVARGAAPPGLSDPGGTAFVDDPDTAWVACAAGDYRQCHGLALEFSVVTDIEDERWPYRLFGVSCGGQFDRPVRPAACLSYVDWPTVDGIDELPGPRQFS